MHEQNIKYPKRHKKGNEDNSYGARGSYNREVFPGNPPLLHND
jgi:hypothetical protein